MAKKEKSKKERVNKLKERAERSRGGPIRRLDEEETAEVRFLFPMTEESGAWVALDSYYSKKENRFYYFEDADEIPNKHKKNIREAFFTIAYDVNTGEVEMWELRKTLSKKLSKFDTAYKGITDRNYQLSRTGSGMNSTEYDAVPMDPKPLNKKMEKAKVVAEKDLLEELAELMDQLLTS